MTVRGKEVGDGAYIPVTAGEALSEGGDPVIQDCTQGLRV
jgi:hypothetical protein